MYVKSELIENIENDAYLSSYILNRTVKNVFNALGHNLNAFENLLSFFNSKAENFFIINGFLGSGKTMVLNFLIDKMLDQKTTLFFKYNVMSSSSLDDIYISFFSDFKKYFDLGLISLPKIKSQEFSEKINLYFESIDKPFILIFDFEEDVSEKMYLDIINFILHIFNISKNNMNIKVVFASRVFDFSLLKNRQISFNNIILKPYSIDDITIYLKDNFNTKFLNIENIYNFTHGHFIYLNMIKNLIESFNYNINDIIRKFERQTLNLLEFLTTQQINCLKDESFFKFLSLLAICETYLPIDLIDSLEIVDKVTLNKLIALKIIVKLDDYIYIKDYYKKNILNYTKNNNKIELHKFLIDFYDDEISLKPFKRKLKLSRSTLKTQSLYHKECIINLKNKSNILGKGINFSYINHSKELLECFSKKNISTLEYKNENEVVEKETFIKKTQNNSEMNDDLSVLNIIYENNRDNDFKKVIKSDNDYIEYEKALNINKNMSFSDKLNVALSFEKIYEYDKAILVYQNILLCNVFDDEVKNKPFVYTRIGTCFEKKSRYSEAFKYLSLASDFYVKNSDIIKSFYIKLEIAKIYQKKFEFNKAIEIYMQILSYDLEIIPLNLKLKTLNAYAIVQKDPNKIIDVYSKVGKINTDDIANIEDLLEFYFRFALAYDDIDDIKNALKNYNKVIQHKDVLSKGDFLSNAYLNMANIYIDCDNTQEAIKYYKLALDLDIINKNHEGIYINGLKLGEILMFLDSKFAYKCLKQSLVSAYELKDPLYIAQINLTIGDYFYNKNDDENALKYYLKAYKIVELNDHLNDNIEKINLRLNDIKIRVGAIEYIRLVEKIG